MKSTVTNEILHQRDFRHGRAAHLRSLIEHVAHLLPAQGTITAFVHHNTLHAFEDMPFEKAVVKGAHTFGCHPFLPEDRYRKKLARGRIRREDIEAVLIDELDDRADELLGFLGTRFQLWKMMLEHPLRSGPAAELRWLIEESDALRQFREETPAGLRDRAISDTRHWVMRDLRNGSNRQRSEDDVQIRAIINSVFQSFDKPHVEQWHDETWEAFTLHVLWLVCRDGVLTRSNFQVPISEFEISQRRTWKLELGTCKRHRDWILEATGDDSDQLVHDLLIRFCAAFLDQGFSNWSLPNRNDGFYESFIALYRQSVRLPNRWTRGLQGELNRLRNEQVGPLESISESLELLGVKDHEQEGFIAQTLLALRGYAGMIWQLETRGDRVAHPAPQGSLTEFLAVRLVLDRFALTYVAKQSLGFCGPLSELRNAARKRIPRHETNNVDQQAFLVFQLSQLLGWKPESLHRLSPKEWATLLNEIESFNSLERRKIYHLAFERRYRIQTLDAVTSHVRTQGRIDSNGTDQKILSGSSSDDGSDDHTQSVPNAAGTPSLVGQAPVPIFQLVCCIDEREESFRRHLEEIAPDCETMGAAGFFSVAMYYRGAADAHYTPLCPVIIKPQHYVNEEVVYTFAQDEWRRRNRRRTIGTVTHRVHVGSRTFAGGWLAAVLGSLASIPLVMRILFPRATAQLRNLIGGFVRTPAVTQLQLERTEDKPGSGLGHIGFNVSEMAVIVERLLRDIGLTRNFSRLVIICGHGSSSMNNPHEAAHDCGACAGGRGGPNARVFAQMANYPRVREIVAKNGLQIPIGTVFVGGYHNTCDDNMTYYDLDRLPSSHKVDFEKARTKLDEARALSAHERCRRFQSAELRLTPEAALRHVEGRAEDLSQVRPEYGHATNALCFVGRRAWSRGLFLDRRAFLQSYDSAQDDEKHTILTRILQAVIPVCAGINLEYYFSYVDPTGYGCGTKLPHNITSLLGVMNGAASDLRPGLPWQMVEIHEPVRLLFVIETTPEAMLRIMDQNEGIARLCRGDWVQLATLDPATSQIQLFRNGRFEMYKCETGELPVVASSADWYRGWRDHLGFASIQGAPS